MTKNGGAALSQLLVLLLTALSPAVQAAKAQADNYIIVYKDHSRKQEAFNHPAFPVSRSFGIIPALAVQLDANQVKQLRENPDVEYIEPDYKIYALGSASMTTEPHRPRAVHVCP